MIRLIHLKTVDPSVKLARNGMNFPQYGQNKPPDNSCSGTNGDVPAINSGSGPGAGVKSDFRKVLRAATLSIEIWYASCLYHSGFS